MAPLSHHYLSSSQHPYDLRAEEVEASSLHDLPEIPQFAHEGATAPARLLTPAQ